MSVMDLVRKDILEMKAYESARSLYDQKKGLVHLDANENNITAYSTYPEPQPKELLERFSSLYSVDPSQCLITRGSDEGIECLIKAFCEPKKEKILIFEPTYDMYALTAKILGVETEILSLTDYEALPLGDLKQSLENEPIKIVFLCHPNNPTGHALTQEEILETLKITKDRCLVVVDEAYIEFSDRESTSELLQDFEHLVVLRTLSKAYGLAGLRCGVTLANKPLQEQLRKVIAPYPIAAAVTESVLAHFQEFQKEDFHQEKQDLLEVLKTCSWVEKVFSTEANFVLIQSAYSEEAFQQLLQQGVLVRKRGKKVPNTLRLTIGPKEQNQKLLRALKEVSVS